MEDLNKNQIVLLTLLVSFVTSIATGIMTTSLLQQAPVEVTRNINRIVEKTIETVTTPVVSPSQKEVTTVVVKEEDLVIDSINKNLKSVVRINIKDSLGTESFYGIGVVVSKDGVIVADRRQIVAPNIYSATFSDDETFTLTPLGIDKNTNFILFKVNPDEKADPKTSYVFYPVSLSTNDPKLGQTIISLGGKDEDSVAVGRVISLEMKESGTGTSTVKYLSRIDTDVATKDLVDGSPIFNLSGDLVGVQLSLEPSKYFIPVSILKKELVTLSTPEKTE